ncbi:MAG: glutamate-cysteine ligase family protein [Rubrobacteraceae bacterium]
MREASVSRALADITERFAAGFPASAPALRTVGREAEFPLVRPDGRAANVFELWPLLLEGEDYERTYDLGNAGAEFLSGAEAGDWSWASEVGVSTVEISAGPGQTLHELARDMDRGLGRLTEAARRAGIHLLGFGIQPRTPAYPGLLTPKKRYSALLEAIGNQWLKFCVTAGDQVQVDVGQDDLMRLTNIVNAASGAIIALTANSPIYGGRVGRFASGREGLTANMVGEPYRHGAPAGPYSDLEEYVRFLAGLRCLCLPDGKDGFRVVNVPFVEQLRRDPELRDPETAFEAFLFHEHYIWPSARPRSRIGTIEIRPACQQPPDAAWVPSALGLGLMEAAGGLEDYLEDAFGKGYWTALQEHRELAVKHGISAPEPIPRFLDTVVDIAEEGLRRRDKGEEIFLDPVRKRLERHAGPADEARELFEGGGPAALVNGLSLGEQ